MSMENGFVQLPIATYKELLKLEERNEELREELVTEKYTSDKASIVQVVHDLTQPNEQRLVVKVDKDWLVDKLKLDIEGLLPSEVSFKVEKRNW